MSHLAKIELEVTDLEALSTACKNLGITLIKGQTAFKWFDGISPCHHAIQIPGAEYEIGLILEEGKYELKTDFFDQGVEVAIGKNGGLLKQRYAIARTMSEARRRGCHVIEQQTETGIRLHIRM